MFAANVAGPRRLKAGAARDHLLGLHCVTGHGQEIKTGGRVVKNVTGYDLCKLLTGSWGTLAVLTQVTFKVMPRAEAAATLLVTGAGEAELLGVLRAAMASPCEVSGAAFLPPLAAGRSQVRVAAPACQGDRGDPARGLRAVGRLPAGAAEDAAGGARARVRGSRGRRTRARSGARSATCRLIHPERMLWRLSVPPAAASELVDWTASLTSERLFDWAGGLIWLAPKDDWAREAATMREALAGRGGHATLMRAPAWLRREVDAVRAAARAAAGAHRAGQAELRPARRAQSRPDVRGHLTCTRARLRALSEQDRSGVPARMLRLHHVPLCPFCRKIRIVLREKGLVAELVEVQPWDHPDELLRLNPASEAPVLTDGEQVVCDSQAITDHLEEAYPDTPLLGQGVAQRARPGGWSPGSTPSSTVR